MVMKPTNVRQHITVFYIMNIVCLLHASANLVAILREVHYRGYITKVFEPPWGWPPEWLKHIGGILCL